jgi:tetratricopeptide (TPR) repeat protein
MIDSNPDGSKAAAPGASCPRMQRGILAATYALVIAVYVCAAHPGIPLSGRMNAADNYYNLLVQGFRAGQLSLKQEVPPALAQLANPYDPNAYASYREEVGDMSYYKGKLYLYFGATPAVVLFWPYVALTGHYLLQKDAAVIFCLVGFLAGTGLLWALWRRYFAGVSLWVVVAGTLALGLATGVPVMLARSDVYEVSIGCGYALTMLALAAIWKALHESRTRSGWLAAASLAYGLAVGARPSLLFGAVILLAPVAQAWRERRMLLAPLVAATVPIALIGCGLMTYNFLRFDSPFEFGWRYELAGMHQDTAQRFHLRYLWFNFRVYFLEPARWSSRFPFVHDITVPPLPEGHVGEVEHTFAALTNIPLVWLALALPLAWRDRAEPAGWVLRGFAMAAALLFGICALTISLFWSAAIRYEVEFLPALVLLAAVGILSLERALAPISESGRADRPIWRRAVRSGWCLLLGFSVAFNLLACAARCAEWHNDLGAMLERHGKAPEAIGHYEQALRINPDYAEAHNNLGVILMRQGELPQAIGHFEQALGLDPDFADAHYNLGVALFRAGRVPEAIEHSEQALRLKPNDADAHYNLGVALMEQGKMQEAACHWEEALRLKPNYAEAHNCLARASERAGRVQDAMGHYEQALRIKADYADAHNNFGLLLMGQGRPQEAIQHYEQALQIKSDFAEAHYNWGNALLQMDKTPEAISHYELALHLKPDFADAHNNLGNALTQAGRQAEAMEHWEQALRINPNYAEAHYNLGLTLEKLGRTQEAIAHYEQALRIKPDFVEAQNAVARARAVQ